MLKPPANSLPRWPRLPSFMLRGVQAALFLMPLAASAQPNPVPFDKRLYWLSYNAGHPVAGRLGIHFDGSYRPLRHSGWRQWLVRPGISYALRPRLQLSLTYSYFSTHPGGLSEEAGVTPQHRFHQQIEYFHPVHRTVFRQRFRLEERRLGSPFRGGAPRAWRWQDRVRYMPRWDIPLIRANGRGARLTLSLSGEVLFSFASPAASAFEQNRVYAGVTAKPLSYVAFDVGVLNQRVKPVTGGRLENNFVFVLLVRNTAPLRALLHRGK